MQPKPFNEDARLEALRSYDILDSPPEASFDLLTSLARKHFGMPIALVSLVDEDRQWFKSVQGLDDFETSREFAFCAYAIMSETPTVVLNATHDRRFSTNPLVTGAPHIRFYAGAPLNTSEGFRLGTFCLIDTVPHADFGQDNIDALKNFAGLVMQLLETRRDEIQSGGLVEAQRSIEQAGLNLVSAAAHEIRSPLATLVSIARIIASERWGPLGNTRYRDYLSLLVESADHMMGIADRMLDFRRLQAGDVAIEAEPVRVGELVDVVTRLSEAEGAKRGISLTSRVDDGNIVISVDRTLVVQMLMNLVENAFKYAEKTSEVTVHATWMDAGDLALCVTDHGPGMSDEEIALALQPFQRLRPKYVPDPGGSGIGLPLVSQLIELHGGRLLLESSPSRGTQASLIFPTYRVTPP